MKKILALLLLTTLLLTACANPNPPLDGTTTGAPSDSETTLAPSDDDTTTPEDVETTTPEDIESSTPEDVETTTPEDIETTTPEDDIYSSYVEPLFIDYYDITLNDLYTLLTERSTDPNDYEKFGYGGGRFNTLLKTIPDANVLITLEDMNLQSEALMDSFDRVEIKVKNSYYQNEDLYGYIYYFDSMYIFVLYAPERVSKDGWGSDSSTRLEGGLSAFLANPSEGYVYTEKIGGYSVDYYRYVDYYEGISYSYKNTLRINTDDFQVQLSHMFSTVHDNPTCEEIEKFFSEETYRDAILQLIEGIENRE